MHVRAGSSAVRARTQFRGLRASDAPGLACAPGPFRSSTLEGSGSRKRSEAPGPAVTKAGRTFSNHCTPMRQEQRVRAGGQDQCEARLSCFDIWRLQARSSAAASELLKGRAGSTQHACLFECRSSSTDHLRMRPSRGASDSCSAPRWRWLRRQSSAPVAWISLAVHSAGRRTAEMVFAGLCTGPVHTCRRV